MLGLRMNICLTFLFLVVSACTQSKQPPAGEKKQVVIGIAQEPDTLFVPFKEMMVSEEISRAGNYTLTIFDADWQIVPWAARAIPTLQNGKLKLVGPKNHQKMVATWEIRDDFFWPDGKPLTADDFVFAYEVFRDPNLEIIDRTVVEKIEKIEALGPNRKTLVVTWKEPYAYYHNYRQHEALPKHLLEAAYRKEPSRFKQHPYGTKPDLAGPFTIKEWVFGSHIIAKRNPYIKGQFAPHLEQIIWKIIPQTNTLEANLVSGSIDAISTVGLDLDQAIQFEKRYGTQFNFYYTPGLVWEHIDFNLENEILQDQRVRQALAYGSNREEIVQSLFHGKQPIAHGTEPPKSPYYNPSVKRYPYDIVKAKELLDEAGWKEVPGQSIRQKNGKTLRLVLMSTAGNKTREKVEQLLQSSWRSIGVDVDIKNQPAKVFFGETLRKRKYPHMAMYSWVKDPLTLSDTIWRCDYIPKASNHFMGQNMTTFCNREVDRLLQAASRELDVKKRITMAHQVEDILAIELPALPLFFRTDVSVTHKALKGWKPLGILQPMTWNAYEWKWGN